MNSSLARVRTGLVVLTTVFVFAVCGYRVLLQTTWLEAVYMVVITISTVGYGERTQMGPTFQAYSIFVILIGMTAAAYTIGGLFQMMTEGEIQRALGMTRVTREIERLKDHVIVCGFGRIGQILAAELHRDGRKFVVIDNNAEVVSEAYSEGYLAFQGDATEDDVLKLAGVERAKTLVTALPSDAANVFITLTSRNLTKGLQIIARGEYPTTQKKLLQAGADRVVLPAAIGARQMASMITRPSTLEFLEMVAGRSFMDIEMDELTLPDGCQLVGRTVHEAEARRRHGLLVVAVKRSEGEMVFNPDGDFAFQPADTIIVMGRPGDVARFREEYQL